MGIASAISTKNVGPFFVCFIISTVVGLITFAILQILLSSQILMVLYLEKISNEIENIKIKHITIHQQSKHFHILLHKMLIVI